MRARLRLLFWLSLLAGCSSATGGELVTFSAVAAGAMALGPDGSLEFENDRGWRIALSSATLHVGAVYLNQARPVSGAQSTSCVLPGTYVAQVTSGLDVDLLSQAPQPFPGLGIGITLPARTAQVWLTGGPIDAPSDPTPILKLAGEAGRAGAALTFEATLTIGSNRTEGSTDVAGAAPICKQRIVSPVPADLVPSPSGALSLAIDPTLLFTNINFDEASAASRRYVFHDDGSDQPSRNLYANLHATALYRLDWRP